MKLVEHVAKRFEETYKRGETPWIRRTISIHTKQFVRFAKEEFPKGTVLDFGCGNGWLSEYFAKEGFHVIGIDSSRTAIDDAKLSAKKKKLPIKYFVGNALSYRLSQNKFDVVFDKGLFHHIPESEWKNYKNQVMCALKPNGLFYLSVFSTKSIKKGFSPKKAGRMWNRVKDVSGYWTYDHFFDAKLLHKIFDREFEFVRIKEDAVIELNGSHILYVTMRKKNI